MENENEYGMAEQYGYAYSDIISGRRSDTRPGRYVSWDIESERPIVSVELERMRMQLETASAIDLQLFADRVGYSESISTKIKLDCSLDDILTKQKRGLKPYYQEKLEYKIDGSNDGAYIEYEPGTDLAPTQKIEWLSPKLIEKINSCYESKKQAYKDKKESDEKYLITLAEIDQAIENYKTKGHNFIL